MEKSKIAVSMPYQYQPQTGRFRDLRTGRFVRLAEVESVVDREVEFLRNKLGSIASRFSENQKNVSEFQVEIAQAIKDSHLRLGAIASGGRDRLDAKSFGAIGGRLSDEFVNYLYGFGKDITENDYSKEYLVWRSKLYAKSARQSFHAAIHQTRLKDGAKLAKRSLSNAAHCPECLLHQTFGEWVLASAITPVGANCSCRGNCKCRIAYR